MAELKVPIHVNLPDDWVEQIVNRLQNDPESEWAQIVRCKDCMYANRDTGGKDIYCIRISSYPWHDDSFCSDAKRREG